MREGGDDLGTTARSGERQASLWLVNRAEPPRLCGLRDLCVRILPPGSGLESRPRSPDENPRSSKADLAWTFRSIRYHNFAQRFAIGIGRALDTNLVFAHQLKKHPAIFLPGPSRLRDVAPVLRQ